MYFYEIRKNLTNYNELNNITINIYHHSEKLKVL